MKKIFKLIIAASILFAFAGQAAAFSTDDLILVAYNETANESATVLGDVNEIDEVISVYLDLSDVGVDSWSDVSVGAFSSDGSTEGNAWFATTLSTGSETITESKLNNFVSGANNIYQQFGADETSYVGLASENLSYDKMMNLNSTAPGAYGGINSYTSYGEANLASLDDGDYVEIYLYHYVFDLDTALATDFAQSFILDTGSDSSTDYAAVIRIYDTNASAVPIPGSVLLLGSGLLGLFGIRRKKA